MHPYEHRMNVHKQQCLIWPFRVAATESCPHADGAWSNGLIIVVLRLVLLLTSSLPDRAAGAIPAARPSAEARNDKGRLGLPRAAFFCAIRAGEVLP